MIALFVQWLLQLLRLFMIYRYNDGGFAA